MQGQSHNHHLYTAAQARELDRIAIEEQGIPGHELMERAGLAAFQALRHTWPRLRSMSVFCGVGNNGGDGYVVARLAHEAGLKVTVWQLGDAQRIRGDALSAKARMEAVGLHTQPFDAKAATSITQADEHVAVDGLLGTGLSGEVSGQWAEGIATINSLRASGAKVLALDIPSGLHADTGVALGSHEGPAVQAHVTVTFIGKKVGLVTGLGPDYCGHLVFDDLHVPETVYERQTPTAHGLSWAHMRNLLQPRRPSAHKGDFGHVLVIGGNCGMLGAARLAAEAALRTGAGLVSLATRPEHAVAIAAARPEIMCHGIEHIHELNPLLQKATVVAIGPGLGQDAWAQALLSTVLESHLPLVVDADALNLLALEPAKRDNWILTPHPGEAARLLNKSGAEVQADRLLAAKELQEALGGVVVLKGAGSVVTDGEEAGICIGGNPGMASGGMGDVLTGVIASLVAQGMDLLQAAQLGVCLHAEAADRAAEQGERGLIASDLFSVIRGLVG